jgi:hypothetical protein
MYTNFQKQFTILVESEHVKLKILQTFGFQILYFNQNLNQSEVFDMFIAPKDRYT